mgnify:FL=1
MRMNFLIAAGLLIFSLSARAEDSCGARKALFGKIIATCGDKNLVYVGVMTNQVLGIRTAASLFELTSCEGAPRLDLVLRSNSEGYEFTLVQPYVLQYDNKGKSAVTETVRISHMWGRFHMTSKRSDQPESVFVECTRYNDPNPNPEFLQQ